jgi:dGTPase
MASFLITRFIDAVQLDEHGKVSIDRDVELQVAVLKQLTWYYVIDHPALATVQRGERLVIRELFEILSQWARDATADEHEHARLPSAFRELLEAVQWDKDNAAAKGAALEAAGNGDYVAVRATVDYIASLTEVQAIRLHERLTGRSAGSIFESWIGV